MGFKVFKVMFNHFFIVLGNSLPNYRRFNQMRPRFYRLAGLNIARGATITGPLSLRVDTTDRISIGRGTYLNSETRFGCQDSRIIIGEDVLVGPRVCFESASHNLIYEEGKGRGLLTSEIVVGDKAWIGAGAILLQGIEVGERAVVAAGAVVTRDVPPNTIVGGVPAKVIKQLAEEQVPREET